MGHFAGRPLRLQSRDAPIRIANWRRTFCSHESYIVNLRTRGLAVPMLFRVVLGLRPECVLVNVQPMLMGTSCFGW